MSKKQNPIAAFIPNYKYWIDKDIWICADIHANHKNIAYGSSNWSDKEQSTRLFNDEIEMTDTIVENINKLVQKDDVIIHVGDWSFGGYKNVYEFRRRINCDKIINIFGNHDHNIRMHEELQECFLWTGDYLELALDKQFIVICHYPIESWNNMGNGSIMLHGHSHHNLRKIPRRVDVGLDGKDYNYSPLNLRKLIKTVMETENIYKADHH